MAALDPGFLALLRWDWDLRVLHFPSDHPILGSPVCRAENCAKPSGLRTGLCPSCRKRWEASGQDIEHFTREYIRFTRSIGIMPCTITDCARPWTTSVSRLCATHLAQRKTLAMTLEEFQRHPGALPLPGFGPCQVAACYRERDLDASPYCSAHAQRRRWQERKGLLPAGLDENQWRLTAPAVSVAGEISLRGLPPLVVAEVLYGLQLRTAKGVRTRDDLMRPACNYVRSSRAASLESVDLSAVDSNAGSIQLLGIFQKYLRRLSISPETERVKDVWDLAAFGHAGTLRFDRIRQPSLREATKIWAYDSVPRRRGGSVGSTTQAMINSIAMLSDSLWLQRKDHGQVNTGLGRLDILSFVNRMVFLTQDGQISPNHHLHICRSVRRILNRWRTLSLTRVGQPLDGLPSDFVLDQEDLPDPPEDREAGRDLPTEVMRQLCDNLGLLESMSTREVRVAVELMIDTGRRPDEIYKLHYDCLQRDPDGSLVLLYDNHKAYRLGRRLPIGAATGGVITRQQERVRARFPDTPVTELRLLPAITSNPMGRKPLPPVSDRHREWIDALPDFLVPTTIETDGLLVTKMLPFDRAKIFCYAYRHTYAQRHADAGIEPDVLRKLMDHRQLSTTQAYYRVREERTREAVDRITAMQFDRHGSRIWRGVQEVLDSEHLRRSVGETPVAYGLCTEPTNVTAGGKACPVRFRCLGCGHFRTDISYLPDLEAYLTDLRRNRERLIGAFDADEWAKAEAMPSDEEIGRVKRLIDRVRTALEDLTQEEKAQIMQAVDLVRRGRTTLLGMPRIGQPEPDIHIGGQSPCPSP